MYWRNCKQLLTIMVWAITVFIPSHLWYTCIVLYKVWILFFKAVASSWWKYGDLGPYLIYNRPPPHTLPHALIYIVLTTMAWTWSEMDFLKINSASKYNRSTYICLVVQHFAPPPTITLVITKNKLFLCFSLICWDRKKS